MNLSQHKPSGWHMPVTVVVLLLSAFLGFYHLGHESLWADELATWARTTQPSLAESVTVGAVDSMWPLYHGGLYLFIKLAGDSELALRFPSALAGVMAVAALYGLGRYLFTPAVGAAGAALMSLSLTQISYSQEARVYAVEMLAVILAMWAWLRLLEAIRRDDRSIWKRALWYALAAVAVIYLHIFGLMLLAMQGIAALVFALVRRRGVWPVAGLYALLAAASVPILLTVPRMMSIKNDFISAPGGLTETLAAHLSYAFSGDAWLPAALVVVGAVGIALALLGRNQAGPGRAALWPTWVLAAWYLGPFLILYGLSVTVRPVLYERYLLLAQPPIYLLAALAILRLPVRRVVQAGAVLAAMAVLVVELTAGQGYYTRLQKPDYRGMVDYSLSAVPGAQKVLVTGVPWPFPTVYGYYLRKNPPGSDRLIYSTAWTQADMAAVLAKTKADRVWKLTWNDIVRARFLKQQNYQFIEQRDFAGGYTMTLYQEPAP